MRKKIVPYVIAAGTVLVSAVPAQAVPVVPNFTQGSMTSHTETTSTVVETINSMDYATGWQYSVSGVNIEHDGASKSPGTDTSTNTNDVVKLSKSNKLTVEIEENTKEPFPYIEVRDRLEALISRNVFYKLVDLAKEEKGRLYIESDSQTFILGET